MNKILTPILLAAAMLGAPAPALALTADEVGNKMNSDQFAAWLAGANDMAGYLFVRLGDPERARCMQEWGDRDRQEYIREIVDTLRANPTLPAAAVYEVLIKRHCGEYK